MKKQKVTPNPIYIYNSEKTCIEEEQVFEADTMDFLYHNRMGIILNKYLLSRQWFSTLYGIIQKRHFSRKKIRAFIQAHNIDMSQFEKPVERYHSFNDFFIRKILPHHRPIDKNSNTLISPADARLMAYTISNNLVIPVKGKTFSIQRLLNSTSLGNTYNNGYCLVFRLAPADYHRFCFIDNGTQSPIQRINGKYHSVSPISLRKMIDVFCENIREYCTLSTENFGEVIQVDVGALVVGKIQQHHRTGTTTQRGGEKGYFEFGGSTIILLIKPHQVVLNTDILLYSNKGIETLVKMGQKIGRKNF